VQVIKYSPLIFDFELIVLDEPYHFTLHCGIVSIKQKNFSIIMKISKRKYHQYVEKIYYIGIPKEFEIVDSRHLEPKDHLDKSQ
jgi:hypothetical protein